MFAVRVAARLLGLALLLQLTLTTGGKLPDCPESGLTNNTESCQQGLSFVDGHPACHGSLAERCCRQVDQLVKLSCHCWSGIKASQRHYIEGLLTQCKPKRDQKRRNRKRTEAGARLFVGVLTAGKNQLARQAVRDTWGSDPRLHRVLFFLAKPRDERVFDAVRKEAVSKGDLVMLPTIWEGYYNITHQTLEVMRASVLDTRVTHTMKVDDDSYVRVEDVLRKVEKAPAARLLMGFIENPGGGPHRNPGNQWYVTPEEWAADHYPPWAHGAGYIISQDLVKEIVGGAALKAQNHNIFKLEDVAVGSWIDYVAKDKSWAVNYVFDAAFNFNGCDRRDVVSHYIKPRAMLCMFESGGACCTALSLGRPHLRGGRIKP